MLIVINQSPKLFNHNLFKNFFYPLIKDNKLIFIEPPLNINNYSDIKTNIENILYKNHITNFNICILYNRNNYIKEPLRGSIINNINQIKEQLIKPLSKYYTFNNLIFLELDNILKNENNTPLDDLINISYEFDLNGYISNSIDNNLNKIIITDKDFYELDNTYHKEGKIPNIIDNKINYLNDNYKDLSWYKEKLIKIKDILSSESNLTNKPSIILKRLLKLEVSTYSSLDTLILRIKLNINPIDSNKEIITYKKQLAITSFLILLATTNNTLIFDNNKLLNKENHYEISANINTKILSNILNIYNINLNNELKRINNYKNNEIEYREFSPNKLNLLLEMTQPSFPLIPKINLFTNKQDIHNIDNFITNLYNRYLTAINISNKRLIELTTKLRIQKEHNSLGKTIKTTTIELNDKLNTLKKQENDLKQAIATYKQKDIITIDPNIKNQLDKESNNIKELIANKLDLITFIKILLLIFIPSLCIYLFIKNYYNSIITLIIPIIIYSIFELVNTLKLRNQIITKINNLIESNNTLINNLLNDDKEKALYIQNIYNLMMIKKYLSECSLIISNYNKLQAKIIYHYNNLIEHIDINSKLIDLLNLKENNLDINYLDNLKIDINNNIENNIIYCPTNHIIDNIKATIIINKEKKIDINNKLTNYIDNFIIDYDKEYNNE